jgi:hypothetical protein
VIAVRSRGFVYLAALIVALGLALGALVGSANTANATHISYCEGPYGDAGFTYSQYFNYYEHYGYECFRDPFTGHYTPPSYANPLCAYDPSFC